MTAKIAMGMTLEEIPVAGGTAAMEPVLDYYVAKFPRFPFDTFTSAPNVLGTQMKATGEVMGIGSTLEECFLKSVRSLETGVCHFHLAKFDAMAADEIYEYIREFRDDNIYAVTELLRRGETVERLHEATMITELFLESLRKIVDMEKALSAHVNDVETLRAAKKMGFSDKFISRSGRTRQSCAATFSAPPPPERRRRFGWANGSEYGPAAPPRFPGRETRVKKHKNRFPRHGYFCFLSY